MKFLIESGNCFAVYTTGKCFAFLDTKNCLKVLGNISREGDKFEQKECLINDEFLYSSSDGIGKLK